MSKIGSKIRIMDKSIPRKEPTITIKHLSPGTIFKTRFNDNDDKEYICMMVDSKRCIEDRVIECTVLQLNPDLGVYVTFLHGDGIPIEIYDYEIILNKPISDKDK